MRKITYVGNVTKIRIQRGALKVQYYFQAIHYRSHGLIKGEFE